MTNLKNSSSIGDLIGIRIADKITGTASQCDLETTSQIDEKSIEIPKETSMPP